MMQATHRNDSPEGAEKGRECQGWDHLVGRILSISRPAGSLPREQADGMLIPGSLAGLCRPRASRPPSVALWHAMLHRACTKTFRLHDESRTANVGFRRPKRAGELRFNGSSVPAGRTACRYVQGMYCPSTCQIIVICSRALSLRGAESCLCAMLCCRGTSTGRCGWCPFIHLSFTLPAPRHANVPPRRAACFSCFPPDAVALTGRSAATAAWHAPGPTCLRHACKSGVPGIYRPQGVGQQTKANAQPVGRGGRWLKPTSSIYRRKRLGAGRETNQRPVACPSWAECILAQAPRAAGWMTEASAWLEEAIMDPIERTARPRTPGL